MDDATYWFALSGAYGRFLEDKIRGEETEFVFLDIGANQGLYSLIASQNPNCKTVFAFEPNPYVFTLLVENIALNETRVECICAAVTRDVEEPLSLCWPPRHTGNAVVSPLDDENDDVQRRHAYVVGVNRSFLDALPVPDSAKVVVKLDVEGHEATVLRELFASSLNRKISTIMTELSSVTGGGDHRNRVQSLLEEQGFVLVDKDGSENHMDAVYMRAKSGEA